MQKKLIVALIIILLATFMVIDFKINGVNVFESFFREFETESIRELQRFNNIAYQEPSAEIEVNDREIIVPDIVEYLSLDNQTGSIDIIGEKRNNIALSYKLRVYADTEDLAEVYLTELEIIDFIEDNKLILDLKSLKMPEGVYGVEIDYDILVPKEMSLHIQNKYGQLNVSRITGDILLKNSYDKANIEDIEGQADISVNYGGLFVNNIGKNITVKSNYNSQVDINNIDGDLLLESNYSQVRLSDISGNLNLENNYGSVRIDEIGGNIDLFAKYSELRVSGVRGKIIGEMKTGQLDLPELMNDIDLEGSYLDLEINLDRHLKGYQAYSETKHGVIRTNLPFEVMTENSRQILEGKEGTAEIRINLKNKYGDIKIYR